jgi:hypothetical protein
MKYVKSIGLEIEGGWFAIRDKPPHMVHWHEDQSVRNIRRTQNERPLEFIGEASSSPIKTLAGVRTWIETFWPDRKNESCGFHIHTSFEPSIYKHLVEEKFYIAFYHEMRKIGQKLELGKEFFTRLEGQNHHCQKIFKGFEQVAATTKTNNRYTQLNFCYSLHGTLENRLPSAILPVFKAFRYTEEYVNFLEEYLDKHPKTSSSTEYSWVDSFSVEDSVQIS